MLKILSKDRLDYLRAINYVYSKSGIWEDEIIYDIVDTEGDLSDDNEIYLCVNKDELNDLCDDFIETVANNSDKKFCLATKHLTMKRLGIWSKTSSEMMMLTHSGYSVSKPKPSIRPDRMNIQSTIQPKILN